MFKSANRHPGVLRLLTFFMCVLFVLVISNSNYLKSEVRDLVSPVLMSSFFNISGGNIQLINDEFRDIIHKHGDILQIELYKFTTENNSDLYGGQVNVAKAINGKHQLTDSKPFIPISESAGSVKGILMNNVYHETSERIRHRCTDTFDVVKDYSCGQYAMVDSPSRSVVSIPLVNAGGYRVIGYLTIVLDREYNDKEVQRLVNDVRFSAARVQALINKK